MTTENTFLKGSTYGPTNLMLIPGSNNSSFDRAFRPSRANAKPKIKFEDHDRFNEESARD